MNKTCNKCGKEKSISEFYKAKLHKDGLFYSCKECCKNYVLLNINKINLRQTKYRKLNRELLLSKAKDYYKNNKKKVNRYKTKWQYNKYKNDLIFKIKTNLRNRLRYALHAKNNLKTSSALILLNCTSKKLKTHLESQFKEGMTWDNYGYYGWHIDHIKPCCSFDLSKPEEQQKCFHYTNLQPLWQKENQSKWKN